MTNAEFLKRLGLEYKVSRIRNGLSRKQVAKTSGLTVETIGAIERGQVDAGILTLKRISEAIGRSIEEML